MPGDLRATSCLRVRVRSRSSWIGAGGTKLLRISPCASRSAIHVASFMSLLRPGHVADVHRVGQDQREVLFEHMPDRLPVDAGGFHRDVRAAVRGRASRPTPAARAWSSDTVRCSYVTSAPAAIRRHAVTLPACTSSPAHRGYRTSITRLLRGRWRGVRGGEI